MSRFEIILILFIVVILIAYLSFISYLMIKIYSANNVQNKTAATGELQNTAPNFQTDFFKKSADHSEKVLFGKTFIQEYGEPGYYGNKLLDVIYKLNDETKRSIVTSIKYMAIEPAAARNNEKAFRVISEQEQVPLWFVILREATKKVIPEFMQNADATSNAGNVVPLYATG